MPGKHERGAAQTAGEIEGERLQRILARAGIASRRAAEKLITDGRVTVNGAVVTELGSRSNPVTDRISVDGKAITAERPRHIVLNKPSGFITTASDERDRSTVLELVNVPERLYPVGRLDRNTEGLLLMTNDGELANRIMHPRYRLNKEYHILITNRPAERSMTAVREGIVLDGKVVVPHEFRILRETSEGVWLTLTIHEGMNHIVRRMMDAAGIPIIKLRRTRIGPVSVAGLSRGQWRDMTTGEVNSLREAVGLGQ